MRERALVHWLAFALLSAIPSLALAQSDPESMVRNMRPSWKKVNDITGEVLKREQYDGKISAEERIQIKLAKPFKVYLKYLTKPYKGREALYLGKDWNGGEIKATNGSFPNVTVNLAPFGSMALKGQHHPITHIGFDYAIKNTIAQLDLAKKNSELTINAIGSDSIDGRSCSKIEMLFNAKAGQEVTPTKDDTWFTLANKYSSDFYVLKHNNAKKKPNDTSAKIWVPTYYASKIEVCLDDATGLPISSKSWDHKGNLYEEYIYHKFKVNVGLTDLDFDPENSSYNF
jgi:hypothetical protein